MLFKPEHKEMILNGTKTATRRDWKKPMVKVGGIYKAKLKMLSEDYFAKIKVTKLYQECLYNMTQEDARKEGYLDLDSFKMVWKKINKGFDKFEKVYVIEFEKVEEKKK